MAEPKYKRVLIKLSGEALAGERGVGIDLPTVQAMAKEIAEVADSGIQIALVIGGGNLWRGEPAAEAGMDRVQADYTGMLGTTMNALVMADSLKQLGVDTRVQTAIDMKSVAEAEIEADAILMAKNGVDGVYNDDPRKNADAVKFDELTHVEVIKRGLKIMDATASTLSMDNDIDLVVFNMNEPGNIKRVIFGEQIGTTVSNKAESHK